MTVGQVPSLCHLGQGDLDLDRGAQHGVRIGITKTERDTDGVLVSLAGGVPELDRPQVRILGQAHLALNGEDVHDFGAVVSDVVVKGDGRVDRLVGGRHHSFEFAVLGVQQRSLVQGSVVERDVKG